MQRKTKYVIAGLSLVALIGAGFGGLALADRGEHGSFGFWRHHGHGEMRGAMKDEYGMRGDGDHEPGQMFTARFDADGDGKVTQDEINKLQGDYFTNADANKDGTLSLEEFQTHWVQQQRNQMVRGFQRLDADGDSKVTAEEFSAHMNNRVAMMDRNNDGVITSDDFGRGKGHGKKWMQNNEAE